MSTQYTGYEYLQMDVANNSPFGLDKVTFEERIQWTTDNDSKLESFLTSEERWKEYPLYAKALMALRKTQAGEESGHMCHLDAVCSGMQIASALTGCEAGADATGLIDPNVRSDAYTTVTNTMNDLLGQKIKVSRADAKSAVMTSLYGSKAVPISLFGSDTKELRAFHMALFHTAKGASLLLEKLISSWNKHALLHQWKLPDNGTASVKVMVSKTTRIEVDELEHSTFTYAYEDNEATEFGLSLAANVIHSCDAYLLRSVIRRCLYNAERVTALNCAITNELLERELGVEPANGSTEEINYYLSRYWQTGVVDIVILPYLDENVITMLPTEYLTKLNSILLTMLEHKPFSVITVHDSYAAHPNNLNHLRMHYRNVLADMAESDMLSDILSQINMKPVKVTKLSNDLPSKIRESNYAIC